MPRILIVILLVPFSFSHVHAQKRGSWQIGAAANGTLYEADVHNGDFVRRASADSQRLATPRVVQWSVGCSVERMLNKTIFVSSGISFSQFQTSVLNWSSIGNYSFDGLVSENPNQPEYSSIDLIYTVRNYLAVPLEIRLEFPHPERFAVFFKAGIITQFAIGNSSTGILMSDSSTYNGSINLPKHYSNTRDVFCNGQVSMGVRFGKLADPNGRMELGFPIPFTRTLGPYLLHQGIMLSGVFYYPLGKRMKHAK